MFEDQIDEKQQLRAKVKQLQQEISQRARNYMQYNKLKNKSSTNKTVESQSQTEDVAAHQQSEKIRQIPNHQQLNAKNSLSSANCLFCAQGEPHQNNSSDINKTNLKIVNQPIKNGCDMGQIFQQQKEDNLLKKDEAINQILTLFQTGEDTKIEKSSKLIKILNNLQLFSKSMRKEMQISQQKENDKKRIEALLEETNKLNDKIQMGTNQLKQMQNRCQFITKALNESQQMNYQLRLQGQQYQNRLRNAMEMIEKNKIQLYEKTVQQLKIKVSQMEVMKKQYLRAYSKVKQEKDEMQLKFIDLKEELEKTRAKIQSNQQNVSSLENIRRKSQMEEQVQTNFQGQHEDLRLKTIIEHSEDEVIQQVLKNTSSANSLTTIKQIIQHGLTQTNRSTSEKWIKSALVKLQQFENHQFQQQQKLIEGQQNIEKNIHQNYNNIVNHLKKAVVKERKAMQEQFNRTMSKMIKYFPQSKKQENVQIISQQIPSMIKKQSKSLIVEEPIVNSMKSTDSFDENDNSSIINQTSSPFKESQDKKDKKDKIQKQDSRTLQLVVKLNQSHQRYADLKKKYDVLVQKLEQSNSRVVKDFRNEHDFKKFMDKMVKIPLQSKNSHNHSKFTEQFFDTLSHKIFETLCNLPTGNHGQVYFVPSNQQQLLDAVQVIYKFSLQFDNFQQARLKQFKRQAESLTKVLQQIAVVNEVSPQMVIQSINHNLDENDVVAASYVKSLLKKLSSQRPRKSRSLDDFREQMKKSYQIGLKQGKSQQL